MISQLTSDVHGNKKNFTQIAIATAGVADQDQKKMTKYTCLGIGYLNKNIIWELQCSVTKISILGNYSLIRSQKPKPSLQKLQHESISNIIAFTQ